MSGVICDKRIAARVNIKIYKMDVTPAMMSGLMMVVLSKIHEAKLEMLRMTRMDRVRNEYIRRTARAECS